MDKGEKRGAPAPHEGVNIRTIGKKQDYGKPRQSYNHNPYNIGNTMK